MPRLLEIAMAILLGTQCATVAAETAAPAWPPPERLLKWNPGVRGGIPAVAEALALKDLPADGKTDISAALQKAIDDVKAPGAVVLPAGTFLLKNRINIKSGVVLRGAGLDKTHIIVDAPEAKDGAIIEARGVRGGREIPITAGATLGSNQVTLADATSIKAGQMVWIYSDNDPELMYQKPDWDQPWSKQSMGQVLRVSAVNGQVATLDDSLRLQYSVTLKPRLRELIPATNVGIEDLHIKRLDPTESGILGFFFVENCWVRGCETEMAMRYHVDVRSSRAVTVESCFCHDAHDHGGGGHGYGVHFSGCATDCLAQNNIFRTLRHAMVIQVGANGCVFAYNLSFDVVANNNGYGHPKLLWQHSGDVCIHGHYPYATLFEGNIFQRAGVGDKAWGPAGPRMTLFRNRVALPEKEHDFAHYKSLGINTEKGAPWPYVGLLIDVYDHTHSANVIGNTLTEGAKIAVGPNCKDALIEGNSFDGVVKWNNVKPAPLPASLYLSSKPAFWGDRPWPCIGADVDATAQTPLPAQDWLERMKKAGRPMPFSAK